MERRSRLLGLDLGGTNIKLAIVDDSTDGPSVVVTETHPTHADRGPRGVVDRLIEIGKDAIWRHGAVDAVGIGIPGLFDAEAGTILLFPNLPGEWRGHPVRDPVAAALGLPVTLINDARAFTLAEGTVGAGRNHDVVVCMTLGTGIGGGIMIEGRLHLGAFGQAGEIGHQIVEPGGPVCGCGNRGCVEALTRASVLTEMAGRTTAEEVYRGAADGDPSCVAAVERVVDYLGIGLGNVVTVLGPDRIVVGGGIAAAGDLVIEPIRRAVRSHVTLVPTEKIDVVQAELGSTAGAIGAALAGLGSTK